MQKQTNQRTQSVRLKASQTPSRSPSPTGVNDVPFLDISVPQAKVEFQKTLDDAVDSPRQTPKREREADDDIEAKKIRRTA